MGLDITAYQNVEFVDFRSIDGEAIDRNEDPIDAARSVNVNSDFVDRADGLKDGAWFLPEKSHGFRAGSYGGYNQWREELAKLAGYPLTLDHESSLRSGQMRHDAGAWEAARGPFWELILFSDCEGCIGPKTSDKLSKDFAEFQERANGHPDERWRKLYSLWRTAFEMASQNGLVDFH